MFYEKCFRFWLLKKSNASEFASVPASFFKVLLLSQKYNCFRFHIPGWYTQFPAGQFSL